MVETNKHQCYPLVYRLVKLVLVLPVATDIVERIFSAIKLVKTYLRNRIDDEYMSNSLICYVEKQEMEKVTNDIVVRRFKAMAKHKY
jgi:asparagine synthetase A